MKRTNTIKFKYLLWSLIALTGMTSCSDFFDPEQDIIIDESSYFKDWDEYRAAGLGLYALHQDLVEQIVVLGELRGDLLEVTPNADPDLIEINTAQVSVGNKYASPTKFYRLIGACNRLAKQLETFHPEVLNPDAALSNFDRLYGEVLCMRAWAYFNAVRIYGSIPYIDPMLTSNEEITNFINNGSVLTDSIKIIFSPDGYTNDTIFNQSVTLEKQFYDLDRVVNLFTQELSTKIKAVGVTHNLTNDDATWDITVWNTSAMHTLMGQMYLFVGDYAKAIQHFDHIINFDKYNVVSGTNTRYVLGNKFSTTSWKNIFTDIDLDEQIYTLWFDKAKQQQNDLQYLFSSEVPNIYQLKPTKKAIKMWEELWRGKVLNINTTNPKLTTLVRAGTPGDFYRGYGVSYIYKKDGVTMSSADVAKVLDLRRLGYPVQADEMMRGVDTVVYKYSLDKIAFDHDADFCIYRAGSVYLYYAEIYMRWVTSHQAGAKPSTFLSQGLKAINGGLSTGGASLGIRGRVGLTGTYDQLNSNSVVYLHDPITNAITGYLDFTSNAQAKTRYLEDQIMNERARELAFEGERFYDLIRIAKRRNDPAYLADKVASKFSGENAEKIRQYLMDENNWYIQLP